MMSFFDDPAWLRNVKQIGLQRFPVDGTYKPPIVLGSRTHHNQHPTGLKLVDSTFLLSYAKRKLVRIHTLW